VFKIVLDLTIKIKVDILTHLEINFKLPEKENLYSENGTKIPVPCSVPFYGIIGWGRKIPCSDPGSSNLRGYIKISVEIGNEAADDFSTQNHALPRPGEARLTCPDLGGYGVFRILQCDHEHIFSGLCTGTGC
jgi:hypothetical protein